MVWNKGLTKYNNQKILASAIKRKGLKRSDESKIKMSNAKKGYVPWNKGKTCSYLIGNKNPSKRIEVREKIRASKLNKKRNREYCIKQSEKSKKMWQNKNIRDKMLKNLLEVSKETRITKEKRKSLILPIKDTRIEIKIQNFLKQLGIEFMTHQYIKDIEHGYQCDILIPSRNIIIECDGDYWHNYPIGKDIDHIRTSELIAKGFKVLRLWENEIKNMDLNKFKEKLND